MVFVHSDPSGRKLDDAVVVVVAVGVVDGALFAAGVVADVLFAVGVDVEVVFADSVVVVFDAADVVFADELEF